MTKLTSWLRLVITTLAGEAARQQGADLVGVAGVVQHHQHPPVGQQAAIQRCLGIQAERDPLRRDLEGVHESA
jgi:hypothetical protein